MTKIEQTRRAMYDALAKVRKAKKHPKATDALETALEEHLEELQRFEYPDLKRRLSEMTKERDDCQERMRVIDEAYRKSQEALKVAGEELRECQTNVRHWREEAGKLGSLLNAFRSGDVHQKYLTDRQDLMVAERMFDEQSEKLRAGERVIAEQERLIVGQRQAIADMHNELAHRRVICRAFENAREAFVALDVALHDAPQSKAMRAIDRGVVDAEMPS